MNDDQYMKQYFLKMLSENNIKYLLLSDYLEFEDGDIDIFIPKEFKSKIELFFKKVNIYKMKHIPAYSNHFFYFFYLNDYKTLRIHIKYELTFLDKDTNKYILFLNEKESIEKSLNIEENKIIANYFNALLLYTFKIAFYEKNSLSYHQKEKLLLYIDKFIHYLNEDEKNTILELQNIISSTDDLEKLAKLLRKELKNYFVYTNKKNTFLNKLKRKISLFGKPRFSVLFLGSDGSGKSTIVSELQQYLEIPYNEVYGGIGENGWFFKIFYNLKLKIEQSSFLKKVKFGTIFVYILLPLDLILRKIKTYNNGKYMLLYIDRAPSILIGKRKFISSLVEKIFFRPNIVILLEAPVEILVKRKPMELTAESAKIRIEQERKIALFYKNLNSDYYVIDTNKYDIIATKKKIENILWSNKTFIKELFYV